MAAAGAAFDDPTISPVVRQTLQHWGYALTSDDFAKQQPLAAKRLAAKAEKAPKGGKGKAAPVKEEKEVVVKEEGGAKRKRGE